MTETQRTNLLTACAFAQVFILAADAELRGGINESHRRDLMDFREDAFRELYAALRNLDMAEKLEARNV
jgi:hypothetical protein